MVPVKLSALPVLLLPLLFLALARPSITWSQLFALCGVGLFLALPWLARNVVLSGYLIFPFPQIDLFPLDWKVPAIYAANARDGITAWARLPGRGTGEVLALPLRAWVAPWFQALARNIQILLASAVIAAVVWVASWLVPFCRRRFFPASGLFAWAAPAGVALLGVFFWFFQAPDPRFGYCFLIGLVATAILPPLFWLLSLSRRLAIGTAGLIFAALALVQLAGLANSFRAGEPGSTLLFPAAYPAVSVVSQRLGNFFTWMPGDGTDQCWYAPLPCTPADNPQVRMRGNSLRDGFWTKLPD